MANFGIAWNKKKADGEEEVSFFNVSCFRQLAENVAESLTKGSRGWSTGCCSSAAGTPRRRSPVDRGDHRRRCRRRA
ncbi:MAG: single-stranded DNA-binding protein [Acidimicrobiales bacterium]